MDYKTSVNQTGTLFYTRNSAAKTYRVRFKSFNLALFDNHEKLDDLQELENNYNMFKYGRASGDRRTSLNVREHR